jgi:hypothetical protein
MNARNQINRIARERLAVQPDREICIECKGSCRDEYGPCGWCGGYGSYPKSVLHDDPEHEAVCMMAVQIGGYHD